MKTVVEVARHIWADVKHLATKEHITLNSALEMLLVEALENRGYQYQQSENSK
jgi:hypothetical protein